MKSHGVVLVGHPDRIPLAEADFIEEIPTGEEGSIGGEVFADLIVSLLRVKIEAPELSQEVPV
jgi:hypothetical protein